MNKCRLKFHADVTDVVSLSRTGFKVVLLIGHATREICFDQSEAFTQIYISNTSSMWHFCTCSSDVILQVTSERWCHNLLAIFSGYFLEANGL